jgi:hypothetical protein
MEEEDFGFEDASAQQMADTDVCVWCSGDGCDACAGAGVAHEADAPVEVGDCPWCGGDGCESCQAAAVPAAPTSPHPRTPTALSGRSPSFTASFGVHGSAASACTCGLDDLAAARAAHRCGGYAWPPERIYNGDSDDEDAPPASAFDKDDDSDYEPDTAATAVRSSLSAPSKSHDPMCPAFSLEASADAAGAGAGAGAGSSAAVTPRRAAADAPSEAKSQSASMANSPAFGFSGSPAHGQSGSLAAIATATGAGIWTRAARVAAAAEKFHDVSVHGLVAPGSRPRARTPAQVYELMQRGAESLSKVLFTSVNDADVLLRAYNWDAPQLVAAWIDRTPASVRADTGACDPRARATQERRYSVHTDSEGKEDELITCCMPYCDTMAKKSTEQLACGHAMCTEHWVQFVSQELRSGPTVIRARCPGYCCTKSNCLHKLPACRCRQLVPQHIIHKYLRRAVREADEERACRLAKRIAAAGPASTATVHATAAVRAGAGSGPTTFAAPGAVAAADGKKDKGSASNAAADSETPGWVDEYPDLCPRNAVSQYELFQLRTMVEWSPHHQFCSNPRCDRAIERPNGSALANFKVHILTGAVFCV